MPPWISLVPAGPGALRGSWWFGLALPFSTVSATTPQVRRKEEGTLLGLSGGSLGVEGMHSITPLGQLSCLLAPDGSGRGNIWYKTKAPGLREVRELAQVTSR